MALAIYESTTPGSSFSIDGTFSNPLAVAVDGTFGGIVEKKYYIRNDDPVRSYTNITVQPIDGGDEIVDGSNGYSWKLYVGDTQPIAAQWTTVTAGASISLSDLADSSTYLPFWVRVQVPSHSEVKSFQNMKLRIAFTEG